MLFFLHYFFIVCKHFCVGNSDGFVFLFLSKCFLAAGPAWKFDFLPNCIIALPGTRKLGLAENVSVCVLLGGFLTFSITQCVFAGQMHESFIQKVVFANTLHFES